MPAGTFQQGLDAMRAFESGVKAETINNQSEIVKLCGQAAWDAWQASAKTADDMRTLQYKSMNSIGFVGYQLGEALLIDAGFYSANGTAYYGGGDNDIDWEGKFLGKDGVTDLAVLKTPRQEAVILGCFGFNIFKISEALANNGKPPIESFLGKTTDLYAFNTDGTPKIDPNTGQQQKTQVTFTITGILAGAHLNGWVAMYRTLTENRDAGDEWGTPTSLYLNKFGGYDAPTFTELKEIYVNGTEMAKAEELWQKDINGDGKIVDTPIGGTPSDPTVGTTFVSTSANQVFAGATDKIDTVSYANATAGVTVDLNKTTSQNVGGGMGNDTLTSIENLIGSGSNDTLRGNASANRLEGGGGDDVLDGRGGADTMVGGTGNDRYYVDNANDKIEEINGGGDADRVYASVNYALGASARAEYLIANADTGLTLTGNAYTKYIIGADGADTLVGGSGAETLDGKAGADTMRGNGGNDTYYVDNVGDKVEEGASGGTDDRIYTSVNFTLADNVYVEHLYANVDTGLELTGNSRDNTLYGGAGADHLVGGFGNDKFYGRGGADQLEGGAGNDTYYIDDAAAKITEWGNDGTDTIYASKSYTLDSLAQVEYFRIASGATGVTITGNQYSTALYGNALANTINGGSGNDAIRGQGGADTYNGGAGNDTYYVIAAGTTVNEALNAGDDRVMTTVNFTLAAGQEIERLNANSNAGLTLGGNEFANVITGGAGADVITGGGGRDTLVGGGGADRFVFNNISESGPNGQFDTITDFVSGVDKIDLRGIDAIPGGTDNAFSFIGSGAFTGAAGQLKYAFNGTRTEITADLNGDKVADFHVNLVGNIHVTQNDFML